MCGFFRDVVLPHPNYMMKHEETLDPGFIGGWVRSIDVMQVKADIARLGIAMIHVILEERGAQHIAASDADLEEHRRIIFEAQYAPLQGHPRNIVSISIIVCISSNKPNPMHAHRNSNRLLSTQPHFPP